MAADLAWLLLLPVSAILIIAVLRHREGPVLRVPEGADRPPPSSTWPIGTGPRSRKRA